MPELPEVETVRRSLLAGTVGRTINDVVIRDFPEVLGGVDPTLIASFLRGVTFLDIRRRGKYLIFDLDNSHALLIHLRMTGQLILTPRENPPRRFEHLCIQLDNDQDIRFCDQRKFGRVTLVTAQDIEDLDHRLGPEPLSVDFTPEYLATALTRRSGPIKSALLNQHVVAGLGNIYVDEALFRARIHPERSASTLSLTQLRELRGAICEVLQEGLQYRGTSFSTFLDGTGREGENQTNLRVYGRGRHAEPCPRCAHPLSCIKIGGRSSHFCPTCQV